MGDVDRPDRSDAVPGAMPHGDALARRRPTRPGEHDHLVAGIGLERGEAGDMHLDAADAWPEVIGDVCDSHCCGGPFCQRMRLRISSAIATAEGTSGIHVVAKR